MNAEVTQILAAVLAAVIPVVVKLLNDWAERLRQQSATPSADAGYLRDNQGARTDGRPTLDADQGGPVVP